MGLSACVEVEAEVEADAEAVEAAASSLHNVSGRVDSCSYSC